MKGYKNFNHKTDRENEIIEGAAENMCFCENPIDTLNGADLINADGSIAEFAPVEAMAEVGKCYYGESKTAKMKIGKKLSFREFVEACVDFVSTKSKRVFAVAGFGARIGGSVDDAHIASSSHDARIFSSGSGVQIANSGSAKIASSGKNAQIASSGSAQIASSGDSALIVTSGRRDRIHSIGEDAVICCAGWDAVVSAQLGSWITLVEWKFDREKLRAVPACVVTKLVDGIEIKADTPYTLKNGKFTEVTE